MLAEFFERYRYETILALSGLILLGSGVSLGIGITQLKPEVLEVTTSGLEGGAVDRTLSDAQPEPDFPININTATVSEFEFLPGIGPTKAQAIVDYRNSSGPFSSQEDLMNVSGIGPKTYDKFKDKVTVK